MGLTMIQETDIRIGNLVQKDGVYRHITKSDIFYDIISDLDPVHLTPEIMVTLGFPGDYYPGEGWAGSREELGYILPHGYFAWRGSRIPAEIRFVHELQNLYYNLYRREIIFYYDDTHIY